MTDVKAIKKQTGALWLVGADQISFFLEQQQQQMHERLHVPSFEPIKRHKPQPKKAYRLSYCSCSHVYYGVCYNKTAEFIE